MPIQVIGEMPYIAWDALGSAVGGYYRPDQIVFPTAAVRWSAPGFFVLITQDNSTRVVQSLRPAIVQKGRIFVPLQECMQILASAGCVKWNPHLLHIRVVTTELIPPTRREEPPPLRYRLPPMLRRPSLDNSRADGFPQPFLPVVRASAFLASLDAMPMRTENIGMVRQIRVNVSGDTTRVHIFLSEAIAVETIMLRQKEREIRLFLPGVRWTHQVLAPLRRVRLAGYRVDSSAGKSELILMLRSSERSARLHYPSARHLVLEITPRTVSSSRWSFDCIVLDAGHGGHDPGTIGPLGTKEKDVTLAVAKRLSQQLRTLLPGIRIVMTRQRDEFVELHRRGEIANKSGGKLFVSLHCNAAPQRIHSARGAEVYVLSPARTNEAAAIAARENASIALENDSARYRSVDVEQYILGSVAQRGFLELSHHLAAIFDSVLAKRLGTPTRGVQSAGFLVLVGASMPSVLVEMGFLSNPDEERLLRAKKYQARIADALALAIVQYVHHYNQLVARSRN
ncbi:MAG: N-acetylmuramoyl-L-alanine amidase [Candidatus Kapabacteria bacterium]|nr:N-acetylmuramoyl-L-alanine amidase [Candidatus Kapabacteria bacterium]